MLSVLYFWLGLGHGLDLVTAGFSLKAKNYSLGLVYVALTSASCTCGLVNIPAEKGIKFHVWPVGVAKKRKRIKTFT